MYCEVEDVENNKGDAQLPSSTDIEAYITRASEDIDAAVSERYVVPITTSNVQTVNILKAVSADLSAGRMILALAMASEDNNLQSYGRSLISRAIEGDNKRGTVGLRELREGTFVLPDATLNVSVSSAAQFSIRITSPEPQTGVDKSYFEYFYKAFK